ncbi:hypothetical protein POSPLADRAFT_1030919 [Postia placenta MAD-698-R-SB12]|uniref:Uncharacterized protein n=1 Tax=Postia placenta MAD-698-R-SB12 TaxID=670580 RepID=A0A1X6NI27_9APHY|nr:hypothetical protein POSPLADRAFT_1030919 [Postia placenta MAD-698-R-SB12]OSX68086.1 hypothetical protein POSPLADRAFT_1030919 [Postia placenta MAD-698-R-SB12]
MVSTVLSLAYCSSVYPSPAHFVIRQAERLQPLVLLIPTCDERLLETVRHILQNGISVDICVLLDYLDDICGSIVLTKRAKRLHGVLLPHSWLVRVIRSQYLYEDTEPPLVAYMNAMVGLLERLVNGENGDHLLYKRQRLSCGAQVNRMYGTFIARCCSYVCLLGINIDDVQLHEDILKAITSVQSPGHARRYIIADTWDQLASTIWMYSAAISSLDSIVQLQTTTQTETFKLPPHAHVRVVTCETLDEVPSFLAHGSSPMAISRACLPPFRSRPPDENQILAAMVICRAYKRYRSRHRSESTFIQKLRDHSYDICLDAAKTMTGPYRHYRLLFLGCVPHLLVGLECMDLHATRVIDDQQEKLKQAEVKKLDATYANIAEARKLLEDVRRLKIDLQPEAVGHKECNLQCLSTHTRTFQHIVRRLPSTVTQQWQEDIDIGTRILENVFAEK